NENRCKSCSLLRAVIRKTRRSRNSHFRALADGRTDRNGAVCLGAGRSPPAPCMSAAARRYAFGQPHRRLLENSLRGLLLRLALEWLGPARDYGSETAPTPAPDHRISARCEPNRR